MKDNGVWLSMQPLLDDEDALKFGNPFSTRKWIETTEVTDTVYNMANPHKNFVVIMKDGKIYKNTIQ